MKKSLAMGGSFQEFWPRISSLSTRVLENMQRDLGPRIGEAIWRRIEAVSEAEFALSWFERYGHGAFIWRAYSEVRKAASAAPEYKAAIQDLDEQVRAALLAKSAGESTSYEEMLSDEGINKLTEKILVHIDAIANDLIRLRGTATPADVRRLRAAVRLGGPLNPRRASSAVKTEFIIGEFHFQVYDIVKELGGAEKGRTWSMAKICASVGAAMGVSRFHVSKVVNAYLEEDLDCKERLEIRLILGLAKGATNAPPARRKTVPSKKRKKPATVHAWRH